MNSIFNINKNKKINPYTTPNGFFDKLEDDIWQKVKDDYACTTLQNSNTQAENGKNKLKHIPLKWQIAWGSIATIAASVALIFVFNTKSSPQNSCSINDVDQAFCQLSTADQDFLLSVYQDDVFMNE